MRRVLVLVMTGCVSDVPVTDGGSDDATGMDVAADSGAVDADAEVGADASCIDGTTHMMVFQDPAEATPMGWVCVSCGANDPFFHRFPVGAATFGGKGGNTTHSHSFTTVTGMSNGNVQTGAGSGALALDNHTHASVMGTTSTDGDVPPFRDLKVIRPTAPVSQLPTGAIVVIDTQSAPNPSFARYTSVDGLLIRGGDTAATGGQASHTHTFTATLPSAAATANVASTMPYYGCAITHTHTLAGTTQPFSNEPDHALIGLARVVSSVEMPVGMIAMFDARPTSQWTVLSDPAGSLAGDYLKAAMAPDFTPHGKTDHAHAQLNNVMTSTPSASSDFYAGGNAFAATVGHQHPMTVTFASASQRPPYVEVILAKLSPAGCK